MEEIKKILGEKLVNNDVNIVNIILSYLDKCSQCKKFDILTTYYIRVCGCYTYEKELNRCCYNMSNNYCLIKCCYDCMVEVMLEHNEGKNGVFTENEMKNKIVKIIY